MALRFHYHESFPLGSFQFVIFPHKLDKIFQGSLEGNHHLLEILPNYGLKEDEEVRLVVVRDVAQVRG